MLRIRGTRRAVLLAVFAAMCLGSLGQTQHFYTSEKMSSNLITNICQDRVGYVWVGTDYGLNKYDGYRFTTYLHDAGNPATISSNIISSLFVDAEGTLWVGTQQGLDRYDAANDRFEHIPLKDAEDKPRINDIIQEDATHLLVGTAGYGLHRLDVHTRAARRLSGYARSDNDFFSHIFIDEEGCFWKAGYGTAIIRRSPSGRIQEFNSPYGTVTDFVGYEGGVVMICNHGMLFYRDGTLHTDFFDQSELQGRKLLLRTAMRDRRGNLYLGTMGNGLCWIPKGEKRLRRYEYRSAAIDLNTSNVWAVFEDSQDNLWVGCLKRGLLLLPQRKPQFRSWRFSDNRVNIGGSLTSICAGDGGITWCAVQNNGIFGLDAEGRVVAHPDSPEGTYVIYRDRRGSYWIGTNDAVYAYDPTTGGAQRRVAFSNGYVNAMTDDGRGRLYFSVFSEGFCSYDTATGELRKFSMYDKGGRRGRLHNDWVSSMLLDSRGCLWLCTAAGVSCYDPAADSFRPFGWEVVLGNNDMQSVCETRDRRIILGSSTGLYAYDEKRRTAVPFPHAEVLANKVIAGIVEDRSGDLWVSTTMGIWQYQRRNGRFVGYIYGNGLASHEYAYGVRMHTPDDRVWFGFSDGITSFSPDALRTVRRRRGTVYLTGLFIGGSAVNGSTLSEGRRVLDGPLAESDRFAVSYIDNTFTMEFSLLDYSNAENIIFEHRINGAREWTRTGAGSNAISFHHLQPGSYTVEVRAYDSGVYTEAKVYRIVVRPPWYQSAWAYLIYILSGLALTGLVLWFYIRRRKQELDEEKMKFLINATHDIRSPLTLIMSPLHKLLRRDLDGEVKAELKTIEHNAQRVQNLVNQILDIRKIDKQQMKLQCQETDMVQYVGNILKSYEYTARERNIDFRYVPALDRLTVWLDRTALDKVVDNLLSNAFKYTYDGGSIEVRVTEGGGMAVLEVVDSGMGIKGDIGRIFDRFYQGSTSRSLHIEGTGIGLHLCKMMVEMHHGTISAAHRTDVQGSVFTVRLPLGRAHLSREELLHPGEHESAARVKPRSNYRVLVVDDDVEIGRYVMQELGGYYHVTPLTSAREALRLLLDAEDGRQYDLVVSDVMMPEMDGFTFLRMVKTNMALSHIPVVLLTSKADVANRLEGLERGADAYLAKPFDMEELHVVINNLISKTLRLRGKFSSQPQLDRMIDSQAKVRGNDELLVERVMKAISEHLSDSDFNVDALTREVGASRAQIHRKMKEATGLPVAEFIRSMRLEQAARLLKEQKINVTQVAYAVGFSNLAHFSTAFRKQFGMSPTEYMERNGTPHA